MTFLSDQSPVDDCAKGFLREVRDGRIQHGQRLGIGSIADRLGVSPAHTRQALDRLRALGVVEQLPKSGTYLRKLSRQELVDITQLRAALEGMACALASEKINRKDLERLSSLAADLDVDDPESPARDINYILGLDLEFHTLVARASGNRALVSIIDMQHFISHFLTIVPTMAVDHSAPGVVPHTEIVAALRDRDATRAEQRMRDHVLWLARQNERSTNADHKPL